jgi:excinuclease ABC subunit C
MQKPKNLPVDPGVYQFKDENGTVLYVGKAKNLKNRLNSYFQTNLLTKTAQMVALAQEVTYIKVVSEFEALLLEANLIKKYKPKYNIALKDDKSPLYIGITKDLYPRIVSFRRTDMENLKLKEYFGPFLTGYSANRVLKLIRKIFPYSTHLPTKKICIYRQLGLCNPCPSELEILRYKDTKIFEKKRKEYLRNIRGVRNILNGKFTFLQRDLEKEMKEYSKREEFEEAKAIAEQLRAFQNIAMTPKFDVTEYLENPNLAEDIRAEELGNLKNILRRYLDIEKSVRIECFDIAHLSGSFPTASMVTFIDGVAEKKYYRHFKMYNKKHNSDVDSMREVISRRLKHLEDWGRPDLIIIDGGKPQLSSVHDLLDEAKIPFVGLAKRLETIVIYKEGKFIEVKPGGGALNLLQRIRDEAHRFARRLHHKQFRASIRQ